MRLLHDRVLRIAAPTNLLNPKRLPPQSPKLLNPYAFNRNTKGKLGLPRYTFLKPEPYDLLLSLHRICFVEANRDVAESFSGALTEACESLGEGLKGLRVKVFRVQGFKA